MAGSCCRYWELYPPPEPQTWRRRDGGRPGRPRLLLPPPSAAAAAHTISRGTQRCAVPIALPRLGSRAGPLRRRLAGERMGAGGVMEAAGFGCLSVLKPNILTSS